MTRTIRRIYAGLKALLALLGEGHAALAAGYEAPPRRVLRSICPPVQR